MYNMVISIFGYKLNLEILILMGVVYLILVGHTLCGCSNYTLMEGLDTMKKAIAPTATTDALPSHKDTLPTQTGTVAAPGASLLASKAKGKTTSSTVTESFVSSSSSSSSSSLFDIASDTPLNTSSWSKPDMTVIEGKPLSKGVKDFLSREPQPVPLPEGEMLMFANTPFKPECCPNTYSNSSGCACMTGEQYNYLISRGSNNVPYSEY